MQGSSDHRTADRVRVMAAIETGGPYDVMIRAGALNELPSLLERVAPARQYVLLSDSAVGALYGTPLAARLASAGSIVVTASFPPGEPSKTRETWARLSDEMVEQDVNRDACVLALGGGVTGDLAGFVAATYMRGIPCVQLPTSLLAMIDAATGGKSGVDTPAGKNLIGVIRQPRAVVVDPSVLETLPAEHFTAGLAEAIKHATIADAAYLDAIDQAADDLACRRTASLEWLIRRSIEIKASYVAADTLETGPRAVLNFGHTIGHAIERVTRYAMLHGYAVAIGMVVESRLGEVLGVSDRGTTDRIIASLRRAGLPTRLPRDVAPADVLAATNTDKKRRASRTRYALIARPGEAARAAGGSWTFEAPPSAVQAALADAPRSLSQDGAEV